MTFNEEINPATFTASQVTLTGPGGNVSGSPSPPFAGSNDHTFDISFPTQSAAGAYTLKVGPDIQDWYGNDMNQNRNGTDGEARPTSSPRRSTGVRRFVRRPLVTGVPTSADRRHGLHVTVTAIGPGGGIDTGFMGTINFSSSDPQVAGLPASYNFTAANKGTQIFSMTFKTRRGPVDHRLSSPRRRR